MQGQKPGETQFPEGYKPPTDFVSVDVGESYNLALDWEDIESGDPFENLGIRLFNSTITLKLVLDGVPKTYEYSLPKIVEGINRYTRFETSNILRGGGRLNEFRGKVEPTDLLGLDALGSYHAPNQTKRAQYVYAKSWAQETGDEVPPITETEASILALLAPLHDLGEILDDDLADDEKAKQGDPERENKNARAIAKAVVGKNGGREPLVDDWIIDIVFDIELNKNISGTDYEELGINLEKLHKIWRIQVEQVEYVESVIEAFKVFNLDTEDRPELRPDEGETEDELWDEIITKLGNLTGGIIANHLPILIGSISDKNSPWTKSLEDFLLDPKSEHLKTGASEDIAEYREGDSRRTIITKILNHLSVRGNLEKYFGDDTDNHVETMFETINNVKEMWQEFLLDQQDMSQPS
ncbi:hypothetical protein KBF61_00935 [Candidatus Saccharibacteria bacterium]|nr:hypothetical protein [Candidatus Saccharibacteria bacterium]